MRKISWLVPMSGGGYNNIEIQVPEGINPDDVESYRKHVNIALETLLSRSVAIYMEWMDTRGWYVLIQSETEVLE